MAQLRFKANRLMSPGLYVRGDHTRVYFFEKGGPFFDQRFCDCADDELACRRPDRSLRWWIRTIERSSPPAFSRFPLPVLRNFPDTDTSTDNNNTTDNNNNNNTDNSGGDRAVPSKSSPSRNRPKITAQPEAAAQDVPSLAPRSMAEGGVEYHGDRLTWKYSSVTKN